MHTRHRGVGCKLIDAATLGGWWLQRVWTSRYSSYLQFNHQTKRAVVIRLSEHPATLREGEKLMSIKLPECRALGQAITFLRQKRSSKWASRRGRYR